MPLIRNIQPRKIAIARLASGGRMSAAIPRTASRIPSNKKAFQCALTLWLIADRSREKSSGDVMMTPMSRTADASQCSKRAPRSPSRSLPAPGRRGKAFRADADAVASENVDCGGDDQKRKAKQDRDESDRDQGQRQVALRVDEPVMDRG